MAGKDLSISHASLRQWCSYRGPKMVPHGDGTEDERRGGKAQGFMALNKFQLVCRGAFKDIRLEFDIKNGKSNISSE